MFGEMTGKLMLRILEINNKAWEQVEEHIVPIRRVKGGYKIDNVAGVSKTKKEAEERLKAIKANQARNKKK